MNRQAVKRWARNAAWAIGILAGLTWVAAYIGLGYIVSDERQVGGES